MTEHHPGAIRVAKLLSAAQRRTVLSSGSYPNKSFQGSWTAANNRTLQVLRNHGLVEYVNVTSLHAFPTPFGLDVRAVLMEIDND